MSAKLAPWRRKPKIKTLDGTIDTSMSFVVVGNSEKFQKKYHAYKVYRLLNELGARVYLVAADLDKLEKDKIYPDLKHLPETVDVVIPCLPASVALSIVSDAKEADINKVWFQERTISKEAFEFCKNSGMEIVEGCALKYREFGRVTKLVHPCYWHGKTIFRKKKIL